MSLLTTPDSQSLAPQRRRGRSSNCAHPAQEVPGSRVSGLPAGDRLTLGQVLDSVWEGLCVGGTAECPLCRGRMVGGTAGSAARCESCGSTLS